MVRVIIVDDDKDAARALKRNIEGADNIKVVAIFHDGKEAVANYATYMPDIILMDIRMPNMDGIEASRLIKKQNSNIKILILTLFSEKENVIKAIKIHCDGFIQKGHKTEEIISIIKNTCKGLHTYENGIPNILYEHTLQLDMNNSDCDTDREVEQLSEREKDIIRLITAGKTNSEIAAELFLSEGYIRNKLSDIMMKLELPNSKALAVWGARHGL